jgi:hypothetical protein
MVLIVPMLVSSMSADVRYSEKSVNLVWMYECSCSPKRVRVKMMTIRCVTWSAIDTHEEANCADELRG